MPKVISQNELTPVFEAVSGFVGSASVEEIAKRLEIPMPRRTLQRRLAALVDQGKLAALGERGGRRYEVKASESITAAAVTPPTKSEIPLSEAATLIREQVTRPLSARRPVGYRSEFLTSYRPNVSAYLSKDLRHKLLEMGRTTDAPLPAGTHLRKIMDRLLIDLSWNSSRLEGNTYSLLETQRLLELGESASGRKAEETQMLLNHKAAIELLAQQSDEVGFNRYTICSLHALLSDNLLPDPSAGGRLRDHAVSIGRSVFHPLEMPQLIEERFDEILAKAEAIQDAFEQSFFVMVHLPYLQPFEDVNKRVSRLAANLPMVRHNLSPLSFVDVPQSDYVNAILGVYELNQVEYLRDVFVWAYERSCARYSAIRQSLGEPDPFRLRYRLPLIEVVGDIVRGVMDKNAAVRFLARRAPELVPAVDQSKFIAMAETELSSLHEANFARFRLRPSEFAAWKKRWR
jgi:fido (protein-threonine AMPylation protein)